MSADLWIESVPCEHCGRTDDSHAEMNLTYNLSPMLWGAGMPSWREFIGMKAGDAGLIWEAVVAELESDPARYSALNPENGWGTYELALEVLSKFATQCAENPNGTIGAGL